MIEAAGGILWRLDRRGHVEIAVVHRPRYDDWSLPKGKLHANETVLDAARREVTEETGLRCDVGAFIGEVRYRDRKRRPKRVRYWAMQPIAGEFTPNREVDEMRWLRVDDAALKLSYDHDLPILEKLDELLPTG